MKFVEKYLAKDIRDLTMQDIRSYFTNPRQESDTIEYKSYFIRNQNNHRHKESAILKSICGLLNSEGGMIIWGAPVEQTNQDTGLKEYQGDLSLIEKTIDKDSFVSKISQLITPMPSNILVEIIPEGDSCACIIQVQQSPTKPHRYDGRYWMRLDGQTHLAPHHYVEALMKQVTYPNIECYIKIEEFKRQEWTLFDLGLDRGREYIWIAIRHFIINWSGHMNEEQVMFQIVTNKGRFLQSVYPHNSTNYRFDGKVYRPTRVHEILYYGEPVTENYYIVIDPSELNDSDEMEIIMTIGGKFSPQKWSTYKILISELENGNYDNALVVEDENSLVIDMHNQMGQTKSAILNNLLGR